LQKVIVAAEVAAVLEAGNAVHDAGAVVGVAVAVAVAVGAAGDVAGVAVGVAVDDDEGAEGGEEKVVGVGVEAVVEVDDVDAAEDA
jgi:hypothetical protein